MEFLPFEKDLELLHDKIEREKDSSHHDIVKLNQLEKEYENKLKEIYSNLQPIQVSAVAGHPNRPLSSDYIKNIVEDFQELAGDRNFANDNAIITGIGKINGIAVAIIAQEKGNDIKSRVFRNFGQSKPEGYRKATRIMKLAEKFSLPVICLIDTDGAFPGKESEERGVAEAIATSIKTTLAIATPVISIIIGKGGSGGAIAIGAGDKVIMLENSVYSVISAEGASAILWKSRDKKVEAANALKFTANNLKALGIIDEIIPEPLGGAHRNRKETIENVKESIERNLLELQKIDVSKIVNLRGDKFLKMTRL